MLVADDSDLTACLEPVAGQPLTYRTVGLEQNITLVPYHRLFGERYVVYWQVFRKGSAEYAEYLAREEARKLILARLVDEVQIGDKHSEAAHGLQGEHTASGVHQGRAWRDASQGGQFTLSAGGRSPAADDSSGNLLGKRLRPPSIRRPGGRSRHRDSETGTRKTG